MSIERELLKKVISGDNKGDFFISYDLYKEIYEFLVHHEQPEQEPVAWIIKTEIHGKLSEWVCTDKKHYLEEHDSIKEPIPLYLAPPKREPLTRVEIDTIWVNNYDKGFLRLVRLIEKAHGIGGGE